MAFGDLVQFDEDARSSDSTVEAILPAPPTPGNMLVAIHHARGTNQPNALVGWTLLRQNAAAPYCTMWARVAEVGDSATVTVTLPVGASNSLAVQEFEGPFEPIATGAVHNIGSGSGTTGTSPTVDTAALAADAVVVAGFGTNGAVTSFSTTWTDSFLGIQSGKNGSSSAGSGITTGYRKVTTNGTYSTSTTWDPTKAYTSQIVALSAPISAAATVDAGTDQTVEVDSGTVTLTATGDPAGGSYAWTYVSGVDLSGSLTGAATDTATYPAPSAAGSTTWLVTYTPTEGDPVTDDVTVTYELPAVPTASHTKANVVEVDATASSAPTTLVQASGDAVTITEPTTDVYRVVLPASFTTDIVLTLTATDAYGQTAQQTVTITPAGGTTVVGGPKVRVGGVYV